MGAVGILKLLLATANSVANYIHDKKLLDAGVALAILEGLKNANEAIVRANRARDDADSLPVSSDPNNRDNQQ